MGLSWRPEIYGKSWCGRYVSPFIYKIQAANEITQLISSYGVHLENIDGRILGLCPFHYADTPELIINPSAQLFRCYSCGVTGDIFRFVEMIENVNYREAQFILAMRSGLIKDLDTSFYTFLQNIDEELSWCCSKALEYFENNLTAHDGISATKYLQTYGISQEMVTTWHLGWAPDIIDGLKCFLIKDISDSIQKDTILRNAYRIGIIGTSSGEIHGGISWDDRFRGMVIFPVLNLQDQPIAFGGYALHGGNEVNGQTYPVYSESNKYRELFGLSQAAETISRTREVVLVESFADVIMCHQYGIMNAVATLRPTLTERHIIELRKHVRHNGRIITVFSSKHKAIWALKTSMKHGISLTIAPKINCENIGSYLLKYGADSFQRLLHQENDNFTYLLKRDSSNFN